MFRILRRLVALAFLACLVLVGLGAWFAKLTPTAPALPSSPNVASSPNAKRLPN
jgi:hypothetical protein